MKPVFALAALWLCSAHVAAQGQVVSKHERFQLFNGCRPMRLVVADLPSDAKEIGLNRDRLRFAAESRLRSARLHTDSRAESASALLSIRAGVLGMSFYVQLGYAKMVSDHASGREGLAETWNAGGYGTHGKDAGYILQALSGYLDRFLAEYLRVNEPACGGP